MGLFAGRLYLEWDEYYQLLEYLGLDEKLSQHPEKDAFAKKPLTFGTNVEHLAGNGLLT